MHLMAKEINQKHVESLNSKLKDHNIDPFGNSPTIHVSSGQEISMSILQGLLKASKLPGGILKRIIFEIGTYIFSVPTFLSS